MGKENETDKTNISALVAEVTGIVAIPLYRPIKIDGKEVKTLELDFDKLTGEDNDNIEAEMRADGKLVPQNVAFSSTYCMYMAARAAGVNVADIRRLHIKDNIKVVNETQNFILVQASETSGS